MVSRAYVTLEVVRGDGPTTWVVDVFADVAALQPVDLTGWTGRAHIRTGAGDGSARVEACAQKLEQVLQRHGCRITVTPAQLVVESA